MRRLCVGRPPAKSNFFLSFENFFLPSALLPYPATMLEFYISLFFIENPPDVFIFLHQGDFSLLSVFNGPVQRQKETLLN